MADTVVRTIKHAAELLGIDRKTLRDYRKHVAFDQELLDGPPYNVTKIQAWREKNLTEYKTRDIDCQSATDGSDTLFGRDEEAERRITLDNALKAQRAAKLRLETQILENKYIARDIHVASVLALIRDVREKIEVFVESAPTQMEGQNATILRSILRDWYDRFCEDMYAARQVAIEGVVVEDEGKDPQRQRAAHAKHDKAGTAKKRGRPKKRRDA